MTVVRNICVRMHVPLVPAAATVQVPHLFCSELLIVRLLFEGSVYWKKYGIHSTYPFFPFNMETCFLHSFVCFETTLVTL